MNKSWKMLIYVGIVFLVAITAWEIYQIADGGRAKFNIAIVDMSKTILMPENLEEHFSNRELLPTRDQLNTFNPDAEIIEEGDEALEEFPQ